MNTRSWKTMATALLVPLGLAACDGTNLFDVPVTGDVDDDFEATAIVIEGADGSVDLVEEGASLAVGLNEDDGTFVSLFDDGLGNVVDLDGTFDRIGDEIIFSDDPFTVDAAIEPRGFLVDQDGDILELTDPDAFYDLDGDGDLDPAEIRITLVRS